MRDKIYSMTGDPATLPYPATQLGEEEEVHKPFSKGNFLYFTHIWLENRMVVYPVIYKRKDKSKYIYIHLS